MRMKLRYDHLYITFFNCSLKRNKLLVARIIFSPLAGSGAMPRPMKCQKHLSTTWSAGIAVLLMDVNF